MDMLYQYLFEEGLLSLRGVLRLMLLSGLFTAVCLLAFPRNAPSRRLLLMAAIAALIVVPAILIFVDAYWYVTVEHLPAVTLSATLPNILLCVWILVALALLGQHGLAMRQELAELTHLPLLEDQQLQTEVDDMATSMGIAAPTLREGHQACSTTFGGAQVVLPSQWCGWEPATLRSVLAHEMTHIARYDDRWLLLARLLVLGYWWLPWLSRLYASFLQVMEESCDDAASEYVSHPGHYASALVQVASNPMQDRFTHFPNMQNHHLVGRVGRFRHLRCVELDTHAVYWWVIGVLVLALFWSGIEPMVEARALTAKPLVYAKPSLGQSSTAVYSAVNEQLVLPSDISAETKRRLRSPIHQMPAVYPGLAIQRAQEADVVVEFSVAADGGVVHAYATSGDHPAYFSQSALRAVQTTKYSRGTVTERLHQNIMTTRRSSSRTNMPPNGLVRIQRHFKFRLYNEPPL